MDGRRLDRTSTTENVMRWIYLIGVVVVLVLVIGGTKGFSTYQQFQAFASQPPPKHTVSALKAEYSDWKPEVAAVASLRAVQGADLSSEVDGVVDSIHFQSGEDVAAGKLLVQLRDADDVAHLAALEAAADLARTVYARDQRQLKAQAISQATLDADAANLKSAVAQAAQQRALVNKKAVRAPFAGHLGIRAVDPGQYLAAGTKMVTLQQLDPIYLDFSLPQQALGELATGEKVSASVDTFPGRQFEGTLSAIDPKIDPDTRNLSLRATIPNPDHKLLPGMYANVRVEAGASARYLTLPQTAVIFNPYGSTVFVIAPKAAEAKDDKSAKNGKSEQAGGADLVANQVFVTTGPTRGDQVAVLTGLKEGDLVVTSGQVKLNNGDYVVVDNTVQPTNDANPKPKED
jgi:membrane fusion protein, multidrug efflux system